MFIFLLRRSLYLNEYKAIPIEIKEYLVNIHKDSFISLKAFHSKFFLRVIKVRMSFVATKIERFIPDYDTSNYSYRNFYNI